MGQKAIARTEKKRKAMEVRFCSLAPLTIDHIIFPECPNASLDLWTTILKLLSHRLPSAFRVIDR